MSTKAIFEYDAKRLISEHLSSTSPSGLALNNRFKALHIDSTTNFEKLLSENSWADPSNNKLIAKPDQLIKRRGKLGLITINKTFNECEKWIKERLDKELTIGKSEGKLKTFIIEPFVAHKENEELYLAIVGNRTGDEILFYHQGGVDIGNVDEKAARLQVEVDEEICQQKICDNLLPEIKDEKDKKLIADFIQQLFIVYRKLYFSYLEINPFVLQNGNLFILDVAAKLDQCAEYLCVREWGKISYPPPFGRDAVPAEKYIQDLDARSGASLKLTILNPKGRVWTMVAGGGASVVYADSICALGAADELANYGEYSGAPSEQQTFDYAKTILEQMTCTEVHPQGKVLIIGGGIANFTNVAATFKGIVSALRKYREEIIKHNIKIYVRRGGPNYQEGLRVMRETGNQLNIPIFVYGPETHMTAICGMALGKSEVTDQKDSSKKSGGTNFLLSSSYSQMDTSGTETPNTKSRASTLTENNSNSMSEKQESNKQAVILNKIEDAKPLFHKGTKAIIFGLQTKAVQGMLDFDFTGVGGFTIIIFLFSITRSIPLF